MQEGGDLATALFDGALAHLPLAPSPISLLSELAQDALVSVLRRGTQELLARAIEEEAKIFSGILCKFGWRERLALSPALLEDAIG